MKTTMRIEGLSEVQRVFETLQMEIGDKKARSKILMPAVKKAMKPVKTTAMALSPDDTGALDRSMKITAKRPSNKDKRSKYIFRTDSVIGVVSAGVTKTKSKNEKPDMRAISQEFGSSHNPERAYLRPALERNMQSVVSILSAEIINYIDKFKRA
jgi:HK97 gp10 family phage protein